MKRREWGVENSERSLEVSRIGGIKIMGDTCGHKLDTIFPFEEKQTPNHGKRIRERKNTRYLHNLSLIQDC